MPGAVYVLASPFEHGDGVRPAVVEGAGRGEHRLAAATVHPQLEPALAQTQHVVLVVERRRLRHLEAVDGSGGVTVGLWKTWWWRGLLFGKDDLIREDASR